MHFFFLSLHNAGLEAFINQIKHFTYVCFHITHSFKFSLSNVIVFKVNSYNILTHFYLIKPYF